VALGGELAAAADADVLEDDLASAPFVISSMERGTLCFTEMLPGVVRIWILGRSRIRTHADPLYLISDNSLS